MSNYSDSKFNYSDENSSWQKTFNLVPAKSTVLDIGCSTGVFGERLIVEKDCVVDGIEIDKGDILAAKKVLRNVYDINIELQEINLPQKYDVVFMGDVVEHLARPAQTLVKVRDLLKPEGIFLFSIPNITHMSVRLMLLQGRIEYGRTGLLDETHLHFYSSAEIKRVLQAAGYTLVSLDCTINDLPESVLEAELKKIGLEATPEFKKLAQSLDAVAYQFIGIAKTGKVKKVKLPKSSPENVVDKYYKSLEAEYHKSVKAIQADKKNIVKELERLRKENEILNRKLTVRAERFVKKKLLNHGAKK